MSNIDRAIQLEIYASQRAYNYMVIKVMWKYCHGKYGKNNTKDGFNNIYSALQRSKDTLLNIENIRYSYVDNEKRIEAHSKKVAESTGINKEYLTGEKLITLEDLIKQEEVEDYLDAKELLSDIEDEFNEIAEKNDEMTPGDKRKIKNKYDSLSDKQKEDIIKRANKEIFDVEDLEIDIKAFEDKVFSCMKDFFAQEDKLENEIIKKKITDIDRLKYFIKNKRKLKDDVFKIGITDKNFRDYIEKMQNSSVGDLLYLKRNLKPYIEELEEHLKLVKAVYTIGLKTGDIEKE